MPDLPDDRLAEIDPEHVAAWARMLRDAANKGVGAIKVYRDQQWSAGGYARAADVFEDYVRLRADLSRTAAERDELRAEVERLHRYIVMRAASVRDHACGQCVPGGDMVDPAFTCAWHEAIAAEQRRLGCDRPSCVQPGEHRGPRCHAAQGFRYTSDDWCNCRCHRPGDTKGASDG